MNNTSPVWFSPRLILVGITLLAIAGGILFLSLNVFNKHPVEDKKGTVAQFKAERVAARAYLKKFDRFWNDITPETRGNIERMLYNYAHILDGNDLYTGAIRSDTYTFNKAANGDLSLRMIVDMYPTNVAYEVSVVKNKMTKNQEGFDIFCAPKTEQQSDTVKCIDEKGR